MQKIERSKDRTNGYERQFVNAESDENGDETSLSIDKQIAEAHQAAVEFFKNNFDKAIDLCKKRVGRTLYHTLSYATMYWMRAWMTFEKVGTEQTMLSQVQINFFYAAARGAPHNY